MQYVYYFFILSALNHIKYKFICSLKHVFYQRDELPMLDLCFIAISTSKKNVFPPPFYLKQCLNEGHLPAFGHHSELDVIV